MKPTPHALLAVLVQAVLTMAVGCKPSGPALKETTDWMSQAVAFHGADLELIFSPDGQLHEIPQDQVSNALAGGGHRAFKIFAGGTARWMQFEQIPRDYQGPKLSSKDVKAQAKLSADGCKVTYVNQWGESTNFNLSEIDPRTIKITPGGATSVTAWVEFNKTNTAHGAHLWLDSEENAQSFAKALKHAVGLCGGKSSLF